MEARKTTIENELSQVWVEGGAVLNKPAYIPDEAGTQNYETASEGGEES